MSVYIKGMKMPESCDKCMMRDGLYCMANDYKRISYGAMHRREEWCPLVDLGKHGDLKEFIEVPEYLDDDDGTYVIKTSDIFKAYMDMKLAPTVIEAEDE